jgi:hypothetical protein
MPSYVSIPRAAFETIAARNGFSPECRGNELVFARAHKTCPSAKLLLFTSVPFTGEAGRKVGADAVRVGVLWENPKASNSHKWLAFVRVYRVTSVESTMKRVLAALKKTAVQANEALAAPCTHCGGPTYKDSGRCMICRQYPEPSRTGADQVARASDEEDGKSVYAEMKVEADYRGQF